MKDSMLRVLFTSPTDGSETAEGLEAGAVDVMAEIPLEGTNRAGT